jgi:hypothetical protein
MILNYIDPKFSNIISLQSNLGDFSKDLAVFIFKSRKKKRSRERIKIKDTSVQTVLDDFGFKSSYSDIVSGFRKNFSFNKNYFIVNLVLLVF